MLCGGGFFCGMAMNYWLRFLMMVWNKSEDLFRGGDFVGKKYCKLVFLLMFLYFFLDEKVTKNQGLT